MRLFAVLGALALLVGAYSWFWFQASGRIENEFRSWEERQEARGLEVTYEGMRVSGYPFRLLVTLDKPALAVRNGPSPWSWQGEELRAHAMPYKLGHIIVEAEGPQTVILERPQEGGTRINELTGKADTARASLVWSDGALERLAVDIKGLAGQRTVSERSSSADAAAPHLEPFSAKRLQIHSVPDQSPSGPAASEAEGDELSNRRIAVKLEEATWTGHELPGLGDVLAFGEAQLLVMAIPDALVAAHGLTAPETLKVWRENEGQIRVDSLTLDWAPVRAEAYGALTLDWRNRLQGRLEVTMTDPDRFVSSLAGGGLISDGVAALTTSALNFVSSLDGQQDGKVTLPLKLKNGKVFLGGTRIGKVGAMFADPVADPDVMRAGQP